METFQGATTMLTLGDAARTLKVSKPTISKAIAKGQLSAARREDGSFSIDVAELMRWWEGVRHRFQAPPVVEFQGATAVENSGNGPASGVAADPEVNTRLAALEAQLQGMKDLLEEVRRSREQTEADRDHWRDQAARAVKALPAPESRSNGTDTSARFRPSWWRRLAG
jgi:excisionase family DNA binding protein